MPPLRIVGLDFDNTIVDYEAVFRAAAIECLGVDPATAVAGKTAIRTYLRSQQGGEAAWQRLQAIVYAERAAAAQPASGAIETIGQLVADGCKVRIISHKTRYAAADPAKHDLHRIGYEWLQLHGLAGSDALLPADAVYFEPTREAKIARIAEFRCTHFVDDLIEVLTHGDFPRATARLLYSPAGTEVPAGLRLCQTWAEAGAVIHAG